MTELFMRDNLAHTGITDDWVVDVDEGVRGWMWTQRKSGSGAVISELLVVRVGIVELEGRHAFHYTSRVCCVLEAVKESTVLVLSLEFMVPGAGPQCALLIVLESNFKDTGHRAHGPFIHSNSHRCTYVFGLEGRPMFSFACAVEFSACILAS